MAATIAAENALANAPKPKMSTFARVQMIGGWAVVIAVGLWMLSKLVASPSQFFSSAIEGLANGTLYALIALGYTLVYGIIELINFAHGDLFMLGTIFTAWILTTLLGQSSVSLTGWLSLVATLLAVMAMCAAINAIAEQTNLLAINATIEFLAYRRLRRAPKLAPLITAVGMSFILQQFGLFLNGSTPKQHPSVLPDGGFTIGNVQISWNFLIVLAFTVRLAIVGARKATTFAIALRRTADAAR